MTQTSEHKSPPTSCELWDTPHALKATHFTSSWVFKRVQVSLEGPKAGFVHHRDEGESLATEAGNVAMLKGVGWGRWLVPSEYQFIHI